MTNAADVIVVGAGVQGASLAFHLAGRGVDVLVVERSGVGAGATGRSSGFVRMHYDLESETQLAWLSYPYFREWQDRVGAGDCGFVRTGFVQLVPRSLEPALRANVAMHRRIGVETTLIGPDDFGRLVPGATTDDIGVGAYEPDSGYADPSGTAAGFLEAARRDGARFRGGCRVDRIATDATGSRVVGVETSLGRFDAPVVVVAAGAWAAELAGTVGVEVPVQPWRHDTAYFGLPEGHGPDFPIVIDNLNDVYFRPEGREQMLVGLEIASDVGGSPDRPERSVDATTVELMAARIVRRVPWMSAGTYRAAHGGQDGITPDERAIVGPAGPEGLHLLCGFSGTGFKTAPAIGAAMAELIVDGRSALVDLSPYALSRFAAGRRLIGEHAYGTFWR